MNKSKDCSVYVHTPIRDQKSHTVPSGQGSKVGHTVSRGLLPKIIADPHPVFYLRPPKSITNNHTPILLLVSRPVRPRVEKNSPRILCIRSVISW